MLTFTKLIVAMLVCMLSSGAPIWHWYSNAPLLKFMLMKPTITYFMCYYKCNENVASERWFLLNDIFEWHFLALFGKGFANLAKTFLYASVLAVLTTPWLLSKSDIFCFVWLCLYYLQCLLKTTQEQYFNNEADIW